MNIRRRITSILFAFIIMLSLGLSPVQAKPAAQSPYPADIGEPGSEQTQNAVGIPQEFKIERHAETGLVRFLTSRSGTALAQPKTLAAGASAETAALNFFDEYGPLFGLDAPQAQLRLIRQSDTEDGRSFVRFQQVHQGIPVMGGELIVQLEATRDVRSISGEALPNLSVQTQARISAEKAIETGLAVVERTYGYPQAELQSNQPELWIYNPLLLGCTRTAHQFAGLADGDQREKCPGCA